MKVIDIHCHTSPRFIEGMVDGDASIANIKKKMEEFYVDQTILLASYFPHKGSGISNYRLAKMIENEPKFLMFGSLDFQNYFHQGVNELEELAQDGIISGIKLYTGYQDIDHSGEKMEQLMHLALVHNLPVALHTGYSHIGKERYQGQIQSLVDIDMIRNLIVAHPMVKFILCHMSNPFFLEVMKLCRYFENVYTDTSGLIHSDNTLHDQSLEKGFMAKMIEIFIKNCGSEKLLFGTDFPVQTHEDTIAMIEGFDLETNDSENIYHKNAEKLLNLEESE